MKQSRLAGLLLVLIGLAALRWWVAADGAPAGEVVAAVASEGPRVASNDALPRDFPAQTATARDLAAGTREIEDTPARNAFAARVPPPPPTPPTPPAPRPFVGPLLPPLLVAAAPPPPPPLQVIGAWHDEQGASVFVSGPRGVMQGRVGDLLLSEYRITQIGTQQVLVTHVPSNRQIPLAVPTGPLPPLTASR